MWMLRAIAVLLSLVSAFGFLNALYRDALNRTADPSGQSTFGQALNNGVPPAVIAAAIFGSDEFRQHLVQSVLPRLAADGVIAAPPAGSALPWATVRFSERVWTDIAGTREEVAPSSSAK